jgi:hypothetical protein
MHPYAFAKMHNKLWLSIALICYTMINSTMSYLIELHTLMLSHHSNIDCLLSSTLNSCLECLDSRSRANDGFIITRAI